MPFAFNSYTAIYLTATFITLVTAGVAWGRRRSPGGHWLLALLFANAWWTFADAMDLSSLTVESHIAWAKLSYVGGTPISALVLLFALAYTGRSELITVGRVIALMIVPVVTTAATFFNERLLLTWPSWSPSLTDPRILVYEHGPVYWLFLLYLCALFGIASAIFIDYAVRKRELYRHQSVIVLVAIALPWAALLGYSLLPNLWQGIDPSVASAFSGVALTIGMLQLDLLDLSPVAREALFEGMTEGFVVIDSKGRVVDVNPAARAVFNFRIGVGDEIEGLLERWPEVAHAFEESRRGATDFACITSDRRTLEFRVEPLPGPQGQYVGSLLVVSDATQRAQAARALKRANAELQERVLEVERLHDELSELALRDPLTDLYNRRYLDEAISREMARAAREQYPVSIVMLDLDHFKAINDERGHGEGDFVLRLLSEQLTIHTRPSDIACRFGGDEFLVVLANTTAEEAIRRAEEWRLAFRDASIRVLGEEKTPSLSIGVASYPLHGRTADSVIAAADRAVYASKAAGRDQVTLWPALSA